MRTASGGGALPSLMNRRTLPYDARSTSVENVERGLPFTERNGLSLMRSYWSRLPGGVPTRRVLSRASPRRGLPADDALGANALRDGSTPRATPPATPLPAMSVRPGCVGRLVVMVLPDAT